MKKNKIISLMLLVACMILIFMFSAQNGNISGELSEGITYKIARFIINDFENFSVKKQTEIVHGMHFYIRKAAHFSIYALLGFLAYINAQFYIKTKKKAIITSLIFCLLYAVSDEVHQLFSDGRCGSPVDVTIDFSGSFVGTMISFILLSAILPFIKKKSKK